MKGFELVRREDHWALYNEDGHKIASTLDGCNSKLSIKNCEEIFNGYDLDKLAAKRINDFDIVDKAIEFSNANSENNGAYLAYIAGAIEMAKALSILSDEKFSELDMRIAYDAGCNNIDADDNIDFQDTINSLQQTEFDVEIQMEYKQQLANGYKNQYENVVVPKLDAEGNLILKRI
jgi:hypothetical protein